MSYQVTRNADDIINGQSLHIMIDHPPAEGSEAGFGLGGSFWFEPGETIVMQEYSARVIMTDPALKLRFTVDPPLPELKQTEPVEQPHIEAEEAVQPDTVAARLAAIHKEPV